MFLQGSDVDEFITELPNRMHEPDLFDRYVSLPGRALPRLAITPCGLDSLVGEPLGFYFDLSRTIDILYIVDVTSNSGITLQELEDPNVYPFSKLEDKHRARLIWSSSQREWVKGLC